MTRKIAVVLFNLGGPDSLPAVKPFLFNLFNDPAIITLPQPFRWLVATLISTLRENTAKKIYSHMGGASPLPVETEAQRLALGQVLSRRLPDDKITVVVAMRYCRPDTKVAAGEVKNFAPDDIVLLPLYPQYSSTTTGSSVTAWQAAYDGPGRVHSICCYPEAERFIAAHAERITALIESTPGAEGCRVIFSAHGLPEKIIAAGDPYPHQIERTAAAVAVAIGATDWRVCYQSRVGPMKWIGPSTVDTLKAAGQDGVGVIVVPIAFVSEHSETLVELDIDYRQLALQAGVPTYLRAPAIGVTEAYIEALADMTISALQAIGTKPYSAPCRAIFSKCPFQAEAA